MFKLILVSFLLSIFKLTCSSHILPCDFENNTFCLWKNDNIYSWTLDYPAGIFKKSLMVFMPRADHTLKTSKGHLHTCPTKRTTQICSESLLLNIGCSYNSMQPTVVDH